MLCEVLSTGYLEMQFFAELKLNQLIQSEAFFFFFWTWTPKEFRHALCLSV